jgi:ankyrin repeat protein
VLNEKGAKREGCCAELESKDEIDHTPLWWAEANGHEAVVKLLIKKGAKREGCYAE